MSVQAGDASGDGMYDSGYDSDGYLDDGDGAYGTDEKERVFLVGATLKVGGWGLSWWRLMTKVEVENRWWAAC